MIICQKKSSDFLSEKGKKALEIIFTNADKMSDFQKGRLFGMAEMMEEFNIREAKCNQQSVSS